MGKSNDKVLRAMQEYADDLAREIKRLQECHEALGKMVQFVAGYGQQKLFEAAPEMATTIKAAAALWRQMGPTQAILAFLAENPGQRFQSAEIAAELQQRGVRGSDNGSFYVTVASALHRLAKGGKVARRKARGQRITYRAKSEPPLKTEAAHST